MDVLVFIGIVIVATFLTVLIPGVWVSAQMNADVESIILALKGKRFLWLRRRIIFFNGLVVFAVLFPFTLITGLALIIDRKRQMIAMTEQIVLHLKERNPEHEILGKCLDLWKIAFLKRKGIVIDAV